MTLKRSLFRGITNIAFAGIFILPATKTAAQEFPKPQMMRKFRADSLVWDEQKNDGSFTFGEMKIWVLALRENDRFTFGK